VKLFGDSAGRTKTGTPDQAARVAWQHERRETIMQNVVHGAHRELAPGLTVTRLGYGTMQLPGPGVWGPPNDRETAVKVLRRAVELGVTHIDTSDFYGPHVANDLLREALHPYPADLVIATKIGVLRGEAGQWIPAGRPEQLPGQVTENLRRLGLEQLDLVYLRAGGDGLLAPDGVPLADAFGALADLRDKGMVRHLGLSGVDPAGLAEAQRIAPVAAVQNRFNLADRSSSAVLAECERLGISFVPYFPLAAGQLADGAAEESGMPLSFRISSTQAGTVKAIADSHAATPAQVSLAWLLAHSPVILAIPGTSCLEHLAENVAAAAIRLTEADVAALDEL
jgi:pyridoxine 4-dehydrogenase